MTTTYGITAPERPGPDTRKEVMLSEHDLTD